jgi:hypothetical protein
VKTVQPNKWRIFPFLLSIHPTNHWIQTSNIPLKNNMNHNNNNNNN